MILETWKDIKGYEGLYKVSNLGNIKSIRRNLNMKFSVTKWGYYQTSLFKDKKHKSFYVARLVAEAFIENNLKEPQVNHIDGVKLNNKVENLEWVSQSENQKHAVKIGLKTLKGDYAPSRKLSEKDIPLIKNLLKEEKTHKEISILFNVSEPTIWKISKGRTWDYIN